MSILSQRSFLAAAVCLIAPTLAFSTAVSINGSCPVGSCSNVDTLPEGGGLDGSLSTTYTFQNGDPYQITGHYGATSSADEGTNLNVNVTAVYLGTTPSQRDVLSISFLQNFALSGSLDGYYDEDTQASVLGATGPGSTFAAQLSYNGNGLGVMGPYGDGYNTGTGEVFLTGLTSPLAADYNFVYTFGSGSEYGATISSLALPEPGYGVVVGLLLAFVGLLKFKRSKLQGSELQ
jgi:hypothetical protein